MWDYLIPVENGRQQYVYDINKETCKQMHTTGTLSFGYNHIITGLKVNSSVTRGIDLAGSGKGCYGGSYSDAFGS